MKQILFILVVALSSGSVWAANPPSSITKNDVLAAVKSDSMGQAAFNLIKDNPECVAEVTIRPQHSYDQFEVTLKCTEPDNEYVGGGVYLGILIQGQYFEKGSAEVQKIEIMRAG